MDPVAKRKQSTNRTEFLKMIQDAAEKGSDGTFEEWNQPVPEPEPPASATGSAQTSDAHPDGGVASPVLPQKASTYGATLPPLKEYSRQCWCAGLFSRD